MALEHALADPTDLIVIAPISGGEKPTLHKFFSNQVRRRYTIRRSLTNHTRQLLGAKNPHLWIVP